MFGKHVAFISGRVMYLYDPAADERGLSDCVECPLCGHPTEIWEEQGVGGWTENTINRCSRFPASKGGCAFTQSPLDHVGLLHAFEGDWLE